MVVLRRLGKTDGEIATQIEHALTNHPSDMMCYLGGYWLLYKHRTLTETLFLKTHGSNVFQLHIFDVTENGYARVECKEIVPLSHVKLDNIKDFVLYTMQYIAA